MMIHVHSAEYSIMLGSISGFISTLILLRISRTSTPPDKTSIIYNSFVSLLPMIIGITMLIVRMSLCGAKSIDFAISMIIFTISSLITLTIAYYVVTRFSSTSYAT